MGKVTIGKADSPAAIVQNGVQIIERIVEVPKEIIKEVVVEKLIPSEKVIVEVPVEKIVQVTKEVPVIQIVEKQVPVEVERIVEVEKIVEIIKEVKVIDIEPSIQLKNKLKQIETVNRNLKIICGLLVVSIIILGAL